MFIKKRLIVFLASAFAFVLSLVFSDTVTQNSVNKVTLVDISHADTSSGGGDGASTASYGDGGSSSSC